MFGIDDLRWSDEVRLGWVVHVISHTVMHNDSKCFFIIYPALERLGYGRPLNILGTYKCL